MHKSPDLSANIALIFLRMDSIAAQCQDQFPLFCVAEDSTWKLSRRGSWLGGFWAGMWWRRAAVTRLATDYANARLWTSRLQALLHEPTINRSFVFWYGSCLNRPDHILDTGIDLAAQAAAAILPHFDTRHACWPQGTGMGAGPVGEKLLNIDALAPTLALLHAYGGAIGAQQARIHLETSLHRLAKPSGAWLSNSALDASAVNHVPEFAGAWSRGQAWAMLGMAEAVRLFGQDFKAPALQTCHFWMEHHGSQVQMEKTQPVQDPSASLIAAVALFKLRQSIPDQEWLAQEARTLLATLMATHDLNKNGRFVGQRYRVSPGQDILVESNCANFFLLEALLLESKEYRDLATP